MASFFYSACADRCVFFVQIFAASVVKFTTKHTEEAQRVTGNFLRRPCLKLGRCIRNIFALYNGDPIF